MLRNYLTIALRNLRRDLRYTFINLLGLALGVACVLLAVLYVQHEYSFDQYHEKVDRLYRVVSYSGFNEKRWGGYLAGDPIDVMLSDYSEVDDAVRDMRCGTSRLRIDGTLHTDLSMTCTESNIFNMFTMPFVQGDPTTALDQPNTVVLTESVARRFFGDAEALGQTVPIPFDDGDVPPRAFTVTGVMEDLPTNTHLSFNMLLSYESLRTTNRCLHCGQGAYVLLHAGAAPGPVAERMLAHIRDVEDKHYVENIGLELVSAMHFSEIPPAQGNLQYLYILGLIAIAVLLIACANYMNLATAQFGQRLREIGVRKVLGAARRQLVGQFLIESLLLTLLALPMAVLLLVVALPMFNTLAETEVAIRWSENALLFASLGSLVVLVGLLAGSYPALFLSGFQPVAVLKGRLHLGKGALHLRRALVVFQFSVALILIAFTLVVLGQLRYMQDAELGFDTDQIVTVRLNDPTLSTAPDRVRQHFAQLAAVEHTAAGYSFPGDLRGFTLVHSLDGTDDKKVNFNVPRVDDGLLSTFNIPLLAGRNISNDVQARSLEGLVNETAMRAMGWATPEDALEQEIGNYRIVGVVPDLNFNSLHESIDPYLLIQNQFGQAGAVAVKLRGGEIREGLDQLEAAWAELGSTEPFEYAFHDDTIQQQYEQEERTARIIGAFAGLTILIACLGLFGLAAFTVQRRTKEIGVRKVLGASVASILALLFRNTALLLAVALMVTIPVVYVLAERWLEAFAFRIAVGPTVFVLAGSVVVLLALVATGTQATRAALANPVESLRHE
ncbi:MAG: ABC transporter permease [Bacteroidota bacterium]